MRGLRGVLLVDGGVALSFRCAEAVSGALAGGSGARAFLAAGLALAAGLTIARVALGRWGSPATGAGGP